MALKDQGSDPQMLHEGIQDDVHFGGIEEAVVGALDREDTQAVPVRKTADEAIGNRTSELMRET